MRNTLGLFHIDNDEEVNDDVNRSLDIPSLIQQTSVNSSSDIDDQCTSGM